MAKVTGPLFSMSASGKFADSLVFGNWKGINYVRKYAKPGGEPTSSQKLVQSLFSAAAKKYKTLSAADKEAWKLRAASTPMSGYNLFIKKVMTAFNADFMEFNIISQVQMEPALEGVKFTFQALKPEAMIVRWGEKGSALNNSLHLTTDDFDDDGKGSFQISELEPHKEYVMRMEQPEIYTQVPREVTITADIEESKTYEFILGAETITGQKLLDTSRVHELSDGPEMQEGENTVELTWDPEPGIEAYRVYLLDREAETANLIGSTESANFSWTGEILEEKLELAQGWEQNEKSAQTGYITGESGDYQFRPF